jgi:ferritin
VWLKPIDAVETEWATPLDAFKATLEHERKVTAMINNLYALAEAEHDYATREMLNWFISEQVEEEESAQQLIDKFTLIGNDGMGIYMLDQELAARVYNVPSPLATAE